MGKFSITFNKSKQLSDLVSLGILPKQISEFTQTDVGTTISIPYTTNNQQIKNKLKNNGCIEFEVIAVNHHIDSENQENPTITLMAKEPLRYAIFDAEEPTNPDTMRKTGGNCRWSVSNIRQYLNSDSKYPWFEKQHQYDEAPTIDKVNESYQTNAEDAIYVNDDGFLTGFSKDVLEHFTVVENKSRICEIDGGSQEITKDKVFLLSYTELFGGSNERIVEGQQIEYLNSTNTRKRGTSYDYYLTRSSSNSGSPYGEYTTAIYTVSIRFGGEHSAPSTNFTNTTILPVIVLH